MVGDSKNTSLPGQILDAQDLDKGNSNDENNLTRIEKGPDNGLAQKQNGVGTVEQEEILDYWKLNKKLVGAALAVLSVTVVFASITLIPIHNVINQPEFWYEAALNWLAYIFLAVYFKMYLCSVVMEYPEIMKPKVLINLLLTAWIATVIIYALQYLIWTVYLGFYQPVPQGGALNGTGMLWLIGLTFYFQSPKHLRSDPKFRKRLIWFILYWEWENYFPLQFMFVSSAIPALAQKGYLWVVAFIFFFILEFNKYLMGKMIAKAAGSNRLDAHNIMIIQLYGQYIFAVTTLISSNVDDLTTFLVLGLDFAANLFLVFQIIRSYRKQGPADSDNDEEKTKRHNMSVDLILGEGIECVIPILFMGAFCVAYYGPNYDKLGNVGFDYFQYVKITDLLDFFTGAIYMTSLDVLCSTISMTLLWFMCEINLPKKCVGVLKRYGKITAWFLLVVLNRVR